MTAELTQSIGAIRTTVGMGESTVFPSIDSNKEELPCSSVLESDEKPQQRTEVETHHLAPRLLSSPHPQQVDIFRVTAKLYVLRMVSAISMKEYRQKDSMNSRTSWTPRCITVELSLSIFSCDVVRVFVTTDE